MYAPVTIPAKQATDTTILNPVIIPNKAITIMDNKIFVKKMSYQTAKSKGVFNISIIEYENVSKPLPFWQKLYDVNPYFSYACIGKNAENVPLVPRKTTSNVCGLIS